MGLPLKSIYNNALSKVCRKRLASVDEGSYQSNICNELYPNALRDALNESSWSSALKRVKLVQLSDSPVAGYSNAFRIPNDFVRLINAYTGTDRDSFDFQWEIQGSTLITNESDVYIKYVAVPLTSEEMNQSLTNAVVQKLAIMLAFPMQADGDREDQLIVQYENKVLPRAKATDAMDSRYLEFEENPAIESMMSIDL